MQKFTVQKLAIAGVVGAAYAALALFGSIFGVTYGPIQCRSCFRRRRGGSASAA